MTVALINTNLTGALLAHSLNLVQPRYVIAGGPARRRARGGAAAARRAGRLLGQSAPERQLCRGSISRLAQLSGQSRRRPRASARRRSTRRALCIYTSGTTGLPKAANVSHYRLMQWSHWFAGLIDVRPADRMYNCLPLYHSVGGVVATGATLVGGGTVVLRERFSAQHFLAGRARSERCTLFQYIGELCRYLLNSSAAAR